MTFGADTWWLIGLLAAAATGVIGYFLKRTMNRVDLHGESIHEIQRTYVTKDELKDLKWEFREELKKLAEDVNVIKDKCLYKEDFYRSQKQVNDKLDDINKLIFQLMGVKKDE